MPLLIYCVQILYKSRCDNRLNEISARVSADRKEVFFFTMREKFNAMASFGFLLSKVYYSRWSCWQRNMKRNTSKLGMLLPS